MKAEEEKNFYSKKKNTLKFFRFVHFVRLQRGRIQKGNYS